MKNFLAKQRQAGFYSIRFKSSAGRLTNAQLLAIHGLAEKFGAGYIHLTSRQEISIPFVRQENLAEIEKICAANGLEISPAGTIVKMVTACQGNEICPSGIIDSPEIAREIERRHGGRELPNKITCSVTGCPNNCMKVHYNDIGIKGAVDPQFIAENCIYCGGCAKVCRVGAIEVDRQSKTWTINRDKCINCGRCVKICKKDALRGVVGYKIYLAGEILPQFIDNEETVYQIIDTTLNYFAEHAKPRERLSKMFERLGFQNLTQILLSDKILPK